MSKNKIEFLNQTEAKVKDIAGEFIKTAVTKSQGLLVLGNTRFNVNTTSGFFAGDEVYIDDKSENPKFTTVTAIIDGTNIELAGDLTNILSGAVIKKSEAMVYLEEAVSVYSKYRPLERIKEDNVPQPADTIDLPDDWQSGFSTVNYFEYPSGSNPPILLAEKEFEIFLADNTGYKIRFAFPLSGNYRMSYTIRHYFDSANPQVSSVPDIDFYCICNITAGIFLLALASRWGESLNTGFSADTVDYGNKPEKTYRITWKLSYNRHITGDDCLKLMRVINYSDSGACRLVMVPYDDMPARTFDVLFLSDEFSLEIKKGGKTANGMYLSALEFTTTGLHNTSWILASEEAREYGGEHRVPYTGEKENN